MADDEQLVIYEEENWRAVINDYTDTLALNFETKPSEDLIQGNVDDALEDIYGYETPIGIDELELIMDDGSFIVYFGDSPAERQTQLKPLIIEYLRKLFFDNKERFAERIKEDLKYYK